MKTKNYIILFSSIFVVVVACVLGVYFLGHKENTKKNDNTKKEETTETITYEVTDTKILDILKILDGPGCGTAVETYLNDHTVFAEDIPSSIAVAVPWHRGDLGEQQKISLEQYTKYVQKYFGKDYVFEPKEGDSLLCIWSYNSSEKAFIKNPEPACGCGPDPGYTRYRVVKAVQTGDKLEIDLRVAFYRESGNAFYADYEATRSIPEMGINDDLEFYDSDAAYNKASLYRMTFKEKNNNYLFISAELVK